MLVMLDGLTIPNRIKEVHNGFSIYRMEEEEGIQYRA